MMTLEDFGITRDEIFQARRLRDFNRENPGAIEALIKCRLDKGLEPTKSIIFDKVKSSSRAVTPQSKNNFYPIKVNFTRDEITHLRDAANFQNCSIVSLIKHRCFGGE